MSQFVRVLCASLLLASSVSQAQVLFLSPDESFPEPPLTNPPNWSLTNNAYDAFERYANAHGLGMVDKRRLLSSTTPDPSIFNGVSVVVLTTTYANIKSPWYPVLQNAMMTRPDLTFVMFPDGCCNPTTSLEPIVNMIDAGTGWGLSLSAYDRTAIRSPLNAQSLYQSTFAGLNPLNGHIAFTPCAV